uniref:Bifunctional protein FolD n=1 Tax=Lygus hesperus TaxID=30085 RepID=A0A0A9Z1Z3_LYGHE
MMERFNYYYDYAYESPLYQLPPPIVEDICMSKSRASVKLKKGAKSEISTGDESWDDSSNLLETQSSTLSKKSKKRRSKKFSEASGSTTEVNYSINETRSENPIGAKYTPFITLSCPLCSDPECVLNVAASCPLLRHNEPEVVRCGLCQENCDCNKCKSKLLPVSGLVSRDENGVAETLLKVNGGPIENSWEWANRKRWVVPYGVNWDHQVGQWITSRMLDSSKSHLEGAHRKRSKSRFKRKSSRHAATPTSTLAQVPTHTDTSNQEHKVEDQRVILEGIGFKIINRGQEKILINFDKKNCKVLGCSCQNEDKPGSNCGCDGWREEGHAKKCDKRKSACKIGKSGARVSLMKETSHGLVEVNMKELEKVDKEKRNSTDKNAAESQLMT